MKYQKSKSDHMGVHRSHVSGSKRATRLTDKVLDVIIRKNKIKILPLVKQDDNKN